MGWALWQGKLLYSYGCPSLFQLDLYLDRILVEIRHGIDPDHGSLVDPAALDVCGDIDLLADEDTDTAAPAS